MPLRCIQAQRGTGMFSIVHAPDALLLKCIFKHSFFIQMIPLATYSFITDAKIWFYTMPLIIIARCSTHSKVDYGDLNITQAHTDGWTLGKRSLFE